MGGDSSSNFFKYLLIILFAGGIVAVGAAELHTRFSRRPGSRAGAREMIRDLQGDTSDRASLSRKAASGDPRPLLNDKQRDDLDRKDRSEMQKLVDKLMP